MDMWVCGHFVQEPPPKQLVKLLSTSMECNFKSPFKKRNEKNTIKCNWCVSLFAVMYLLHNVQCYLFVFNASFMSISMSTNFYLRNLREYDNQKRGKRVKKTMHCKNAIVNKCQEGTNQFNDTLMV